MDLATTPRMARTFAFCGVASAVGLALVLIFDRGEPAMVPFVPPQPIAIATPPAPAIPTTPVACLIAPTLVAARGETAVVCRGESAECLELGHGTPTIV